MIGQIISHYRILEKLGGGGMGVVYKAEDTRLRRFVALKFLPAEMLHDFTALERFRREAQAASALNHPNICTIYDIGEHDGEQYIAMEFLDGETLKHRISNQPVPFDETLELAIQIADALRVAHAQGIIHRDIKPANLFVTRQSNAKVLDFGLAKFAPALDGGFYGIATATEDTLLTNPGSAMGTVAYMSPEQTRGEELDARTDLFSFGAVLYEMATGRMAFSGKTAAIIHDAILNRAPTPLTQANSSLPRGLELIVNKSLEKERRLRYQHAVDICTDLQRLKRDSDSGRASAVALTAESKVAKKSAWSHWVVATGAIVIVALVVGAWLFFSRSGHALTEKDTIVLADFTNTTGDGVFDDALRQGLSVQLEQSPFLSITSDQQIHQALGLMGQPAEAKLTPVIAREVCQRIGSAAVLDGSISQIGTQYLMTVRAVSCASGESLVSAQAEAIDKNHVLDALGKTASEIRNKLGESLNTVQKFHTPIEQATTPSLEALQAFSLGWKTISGGDNAAAVPLFERAIKLDPNFAMAYAMRGIGYANLGESALASKNMREAFALRGRVSERENLFIESEYNNVVTGNLEKAQEVFEVWAQTYPRDWVPPYELGGIYSSLGQYGKNLTAYREALRLSPGSGRIYSALLRAYRDLNHLEEAHATVDETKSKHLDSPELRGEFYLLAFLQNDTGGMAQQVAFVAGKSGAEDVLFGYEADTAAYFGHLAKARTFSREAVNSAERVKEKETAAGYEAEAALREALFGNKREVGQEVAAALRLSNGRDVRYGAALALALAGDAEHAQRLSDDLAKSFPEDTIVQFNYLPTLHAQLALDLNDAPKSIEVLRAAAPYELGYQGAGPLLPVYVRGGSYLAAHDGVKARAEFQKILDHRGVVINAPIGALAHLQIGRAYALQGDISKAKAAYQDFLTLWKEADRGVPILKEAEAEYAKLQ